MGMGSAEDKYLNGIGDFRKSFKEFYKEFDEGFPLYDIDENDPLGGRNKHKFSQDVLVLHKSRNRLLLLKGRYDPESQTVIYPNDTQEALVLTCPYNFENLSDWGNDIHFPAITNALGITNADSI